MNPRSSWVRAALRGNLIPLHPGLSFLMIQRPGLFRRTTRHLKSAYFPNKFVVIAGKLPVVTVRNVEDEQCVRFMPALRDLRWTWIRVHSSGACPYITVSLPEHALSGSCEQLQRYSLNYWWVRCWSFNVTWTVADNVHFSASRPARSRATWSVKLVSFLF